MRKLIMSLFLLAGLAFAGTISGTAPASANAVSGLTAAKIATGQGQVQEARWRHHRRGLYFGVYPRYYGYGYYPRYRYYHHRRHFRHHYWRHRHHWRRW